MQAELKLRQFAEQVHELGLVPELMAYEVGIKIDFPERGMRLNTSAYMYDASDYQVTKIQNKTREREKLCGFLLPQGL